MSDTLEKQSPLGFNRDREIRALPEVRIAGTAYPMEKLPAALQHHPNVGVVTASSIAVSRIHLDEFVCHPRAIIAPSGDFLLFHAAGPMHYAWTKKKSRGNQMLVRRSTDRGATWSTPQVAWKIPYSQHAAVPFIPHGSRRIYIFGTEPRHDVFDGAENAAIGFRHSDDDGHTWSPVQLIHPENDPDFRGMTAMRVCETKSGAWLIGSHTGDWKTDESGVVSRQYVLRSEDQGVTWEVIPGRRPLGWQVPGFERMDEGRPILLNDGRVAIYGRTPEGHLWVWTSSDDGKTWTAPKPTPLVHLEAPPMIFQVADDKKLVAFIHNKPRDPRPGHFFSHESRTELWLSISQDEGANWTEPRLVAVNACEAAQLSGWGGSTPMISYGDLLVDGDKWHLFLDHQMRQILHLQLRESDWTEPPIVDSPTL